MLLFQTIGVLGFWILGFCIIWCYLSGNVHSHSHSGAKAIARVLRKVVSIDETGLLGEAALLIYLVLNYG